MSKVIATIAMFSSFEEIAKALSSLGGKLSIPTDPQHGIHIVTIYDNTEFDTPQHAIVVVLGDVEKKWQRHNGCGLKSPFGPEIFTVEFNREEIPIFVSGEEIREEISTHSFYSPSCRCIRFEKEKKEKVCIRYVEAITAKEVEDILTCDRSDMACDIVDLNIRRKFPERFLWKNDKKAMEGINEASSGPYNFVVLFFRER